MEENEGGLPVFRMNFAPKGFSWAEDIYQKWENIRQNNIIVQEPSKIVDAVGEQVRKIYEEVADDWFNPFFLGHDKALVSELSLEQHVTGDVCEESRTSHDKELISEGSLICPMSGLVIASKEIEIVSLLDTENNERKETCDLFNKKIEAIPPEADVCSCSSEIRYNNEEACNLSASTSHSASLPPADKEPISEGPLICPISGLAIASKEIGIVSSPDTEKDERKETCDLFDKKLEVIPPEAEACSCSSEIRYNNEEVSNLSAYTSHSGSSPPADKVSLSELPENDVEREFMPAHHSDSTEEAGNCDFIDCLLSSISNSNLISTFSGKLTSEEVSFVQSFSSGHEQRSSLSEPEASLPIMDIGLSLTATGSSDCFSGHKTQYSVAEMETSEEFEDVSLADFLDEKTLDDCWKEAESYELTLIASRATKNRSYKKKLRDAFTSRFYSLKKKNERETSFHGDISAQLAKIGITPPSPVSGRVSEASNLLTLECSESDWELL